MLELQQRRLNLVTICAFPRKAKIEDDEQSSMPAGERRMKRKAVTSIVVVILLLGFCVFEFVFFKGPVANVSAVETLEDIGVYWDENCSLRVYSIDWGILSPGEAEEVVAFVRNEGNESFLFILRPQNWVPENASNHLRFSWSCDDSKVEVGEAVRVTLALLVSPNITGISDFSFDIVFMHLCDLFTFFKAYGSSIDDPNYAPEADFDRDGRIDAFDFSIFRVNYGATL
jgi:hypothetical protein